MRSSLADTALGLEVAALRQQLAVFQRKQPRPHLFALDRAFWVALRRLWPGWANALIIVKPDTVIAGIVAKIREYAIVGPSAQMPASDRQPKQLVDKLQLREWVTLPTHLARPFRIMWTASIP